MDYIDQRIQQVERQIHAKQAELDNIVAQINSKRTMLENEHRALSQAQKDCDYNRKLQQEGQSMLSAFESGVAKQRSVSNSLDQFKNVKIALAAARRSAILSNGVAYKETRQKIDWAMQDIVVKLKKLSESIQMHQKSCAKLKQEISELEGCRNNIKNRIIPQLQAELKRLRQQKLAAAAGGV